MMRLLRPPLVFIALLALWLLLNQTLSVAHLLLGIGVALVGSWALSLLGAPRARLHRPAVILRLSLFVLIDIVKSNIAVARVVLNPADQSRRSGFVEIPLDLRNGYALAVLACIITATPGTLWASYDSRSSTLVIHVLDLIDAREWVETIKSRYERPLREIFE